MTGLVILLIIFVPFVAAYIIRKKGISKLKSKGYDVKIPAQFDSFVGAHPDINKEIKTGFVLANKDEVAICDQGFKYLACIPKNKIKNILFEDASSFSKRISAGRLLLVGVFALAWRKKSKNEHAYVTVEWNDGRFDHNTAFSFNKAAAANKFRNTLIKWVS